MAKEMENMTEEPVDVEEKGMVVQGTMKKQEKNVRNEKRESAQQSLQRKTWRVWGNRALTGLLEFYSGSDSQLYIGTWECVVNRILGEKTNDKIILYRK